MIYVIPDTYSSGSYSLTAYIQEGYVPKAFEPESLPDKPQVVDPPTVPEVEPPATPETPRNEKEDPGMTPPDPDEGNEDNDVDKDKNGNENMIKVIKYDKTELEPIKEIQNSATVLASSQALRPELTEEWSVAKLLNDRENFLLLMAVIIILLILIIFCITVGCCLCKNKSAVNKTVLKQDEIIKS